MRILYKDDITNFQDLLIKDRSEHIHDRNKKLLAIEMYKAANNISPSAIADFLPNKVIYHDTRNKSNFTREKVNSYTIGQNLLGILGPKLWDHLPSEIKSANHYFCLNLKSKNDQFKILLVGSVRHMSQFGFFYDYSLDFNIIVFKYFI